MSGIDRALLAAIVDGCGDAIVTTTLAGEIAGWNPAAEQLYGYSAKEARGRSIAILTGTGAEDYIEHAQAAASGLTSRFEAEHVMRDGSHVEVEVRFAPARDSSGSVIGVWCAARDVSARKRAERELARLSQATELTDAIISLDLDARVCYWSAGAERLLGFSAGEVVGLGMDELNALSREPEDAAARWRELMPKVLVADAPYVHELQRRHKDGTVVDLLGKIISLAR